jgi:hypothetical protein
MNLARVLEKGIGNLILNNLFKDEEQLTDFLEMALEIKPGFGDLDLINKTKRTKEFDFKFYLKDNKSSYINDTTKIFILQVN